MRTLTLALTLSLLSTASFAAEPADPVKEVMKITEDNWNSNDSDWKFIFDPEPLARMFSKRFQAGSTPQPSGETMPRPVTTTRLIDWHSGRWPSEPPRACAPGKPCAVAEA